MKSALILVLIVGCVSAIDQIHDTCNSISQYMKVRSLAYDQSYSAPPGKFSLIRRQNACFNLK